MQGVSALKGLEGPFRFSGGAWAAPLGRAARARCAVSLTFLFLRLNLFISLFFCVSVCSGSLVLTIGLSLLCSLRADHFGIAVSRSILESHLLFP